jgi:hypothetical protein
MSHTRIRVLHDRGAQYSDVKSVVLSCYDE